MRRIKYLDDIVERDHLVVKQAPGPMLSFKSFRSAAATDSAIEFMHMNRKGQSRASGKSHSVQLIYVLAA
nr:hypothetical protein [Methylosinus sp. H3A]